MVYSNIKIISYNIHGWLTTNFKDSISQLIQFIEKQKPHILLLQEVTLKENKLETLAKTFGYYHIFVEAINHGYFGKNIPFGNAILSIFPMENIQRKVIKLNSNKKRRIELEDRAYISAYIPSLNLTVATVHLDQLEENIRLKQIQKMDIDADILGGDFNCFSYQEQSKDIQTKIENFWSSKGWKLNKSKPSVLEYLEKKYINIIPEIIGPTCWSLNPLIRTDYFWIKKNKSFEKGFPKSFIIKNESSDHYPLELLVQLNICLKN